MFNIMYEKGTLHETEAQQFKCCMKFMQDLVASLIAVSWLRNFLEM